MQERNEKFKKPDIYTTLKTALISDNIEMSEDMLLELISMNKQQKKEQQILKQHIENFYHIWKNSKGVYLSYLPDETQPKKRRPITATTQEKLERKIMDYYLDLEKTSTAEQKKNSLCTLQTLYPAWLEYKALETTASAYIRRIDNDWTAHYVPDPIIKTDIRTFTKASLKEWALRKIRENSFTKRQYYNMAVIIRQCLDYAAEHDLIPLNPYNQFKIDAKLFRKEKKPEDATQVFLLTEQPKIEAAAWDDFNETGCTTSLAIPLAFQTGLRIGELAALKTTDISPDGKYLHVQRMLQREEKQRPDGTWYPATWKPVDHAKTSAGDRNVYLTVAARKIIQTIMESNKANHYYDQNFLFVHKGKLITPRAIDNRIRKFCEVTDIDYKSTHKIRKSYISALLDAGININEIRKQVGHEDERTTYKNYCFNRKEQSENEADLERALSA